MLESAAEGEVSGSARNAPGALVALVGLLLAAFPTAAQQGDAAAGGDDEMTAGVEEFVVRSSRRPINIQEVPTSAIAFDAAELEEARIFSVQGLADYTPNLEIKTGASSVSSPTLFIRGIGLLDFNSNAVSSVAIYNDDVYLNSPVGQLFSLYDVEFVDVKRGPQGVTFARNATAGAIQIIPKRPDGEFSALGRLTYGNFNNIEAEGALAFPIVDDLLSARFSGRFQQRDGYTQNRCFGFNARNPDYHRPTGEGGPVQPDLDTETCYRQTSATPSLNFPEIWPMPDTPEYVNNIDNWAARMLLRFEPSIEQDWVLNVNGGQTSALGYQFQRRSPTEQEGTGSLYRDADNDPFAGDYDLVAPENVDVVFGALNGTIDFDNYQLHSTTGFQRVARDALRNFDGGPFITAHVFSEDTVWQASQELRLRSDYGGALEFEAGSYFLYEDLEEVLELSDFSPNNCGPDGANVLPGDPSVPAVCGPRTKRPQASFVSPETRDSGQETMSFALYGAGRWQLTETVALDAGVRLNWERKSFGLQLTAIPYGNESREFAPKLASDSWLAPTGEIVLSWAPTELVSTYLKYTRGWKSGAFNGGVILNLQPIEPVEPESVDAFEVGLRSEWFDRRMLFNAAAWYYNYKNYQVFQISDEGGTAFPLPTLLNAPRLESYGLELELNTLPTDRMRLDFSLALLKATFREFTFQRATGGIASKIRTKNFNGNPLVAAPPISFVGVWSYDVPLGRFGSLTPRIDAIYAGKTYFSPGLDSLTNQDAQQARLNEGASQEPYWLLNARLSYRTPDNKIEIAAWVRNLTDEVYLINSIDATNGLGALLDIHGPPRMYGVTVGYSW